MPHLSVDSDLVPTHHEHYRLSEYIAGRNAPDGIVDWRDIRPEEFHPSLFPCLVQYDIVLDDNGRVADLVYRVMGNRLVEFAKINMTGKPLSTFPHPSIRRSVLELATRAYESGRPVFSSTRSNFDDEKTLMTERSFYPIRRNAAPAILALITVTQPPSPFADLYRTEHLPPAELEHYRILDAPHAWG